MCLPSDARPGERVHISVAKHVDEIGDRHGVVAWSGCQVYSLSRSSHALLEQREWSVLLLLCVSSMLVEDTMMNTRASCSDVIGAVRLHHTCIRRRRIAPILLEVKAAAAWLQSTASSYRRTCSEATVLVQLSPTSMGKYGQQRLVSSPRRRVSVRPRGPYRASCARGRGGERFILRSRSPRRGRAPVFPKRCHATI